MKKTVAICFASVLALGAAAIAADADGLTRLAALEAPAAIPSAGVATPGKGSRPGASTGNRQIRLVSPDMMVATSCQKANWPYYPGKCLESVETAEL